MWIICRYGSFDSLAFDPFLGNLNKFSEKHMSKMTSMMMYMQVCIGGNLLTGACDGILTHSLGMMNLVIYFRPFCKGVPNSHFSP